MTSINSKVNENSQRKLSDNATQTIQNMHKLQSVTGK